MKKYQLINPKVGALITLFDSEMQAKKKLTCAVNDTDVTSKEIEKRWLYFAGQGWTIKPVNVEIVEFE